MFTQSVISVVNLSFCLFLNSCNWIVIYGRPTENSFDQPNPTAALFLTSFVTDCEKDKRTVFFHVNYETCAD